MTGSIFSFVSFNVFIGSPLPLGASAELVALQELHHDSIPAAIKTGITADAYELYYSTYTNVVGTVCLYLMQGGTAACLMTVARHVLKLHLLFASVVVLIIRVVVALGGSDRLAAIADQIDADELPALATGAMVVCCIVAARKIVGRDSTAGAFCTGTVQAGLGLLYKRDAFRVVVGFTRHFSVQGGDVLNLLRPRAYQVVLLERLPVAGLSDGSGQGHDADGHDDAHGRPVRLLVVHSHLNLGDDHCRAAQVAELLEAAQGRDVARMCKEAGVAPFQPEHTPVLLTGDFNADPFTLSIQSIITKGHFTDAYAHAGNREGHVKCKACPAACGGCAVASGWTWDDSNPLANSVMLEPNGRIDHCFYRSPVGQEEAAGECGASGARAHDVPVKGSSHGRPQLTALDCRVVFNQAPYTSDHYGLWTLFELQDGRGPTGDVTPASIAAAAGPWQAGHGDALGCGVSTDGTSEPCSPTASRPTTPRDQEGVPSGGGVLYGPATMDGYEWSLPSVPSTEAAPDHHGHSGVPGAAGLRQRRGSTNEARSRLSSLDSTATGNPSLDTSIG